MPFLQRATSFWLRLTEPMLLRGEGHVATAKALRAARIARFPEWYLATSYLASGGTGLVLGAGGYAAAAALDVAPWTAAGLAGAAALLSFLLVRLGFLAYPRIVAAGRARRIDQELPSVVTLCYALSRGGMNPLDIFREVAKERNTYGEAAVECGVVVRNVEWFGADFVTALKETSATTPSADLRGFLDGFVTILNSGAEPKDYFKNQAQVRLQQAELNLEKEMEQAAMLAEIYVSGLLVLPLLLLVVLAGLAPLAPGQDALMPFVVFGLVPLGTAVYLVLLETMLPPESLTVPAMGRTPLSDFGITSLPSKAPRLPPPWRAGGEVANLSGAAVAMDEKAARSLHWRLFFERIREGMLSRVRRARERMTANPADALPISGLVALAFTAGAGVWVNAKGVPGIDRAYALTGVLLLGIALAAGPVSIFHEVRLRRMRKVETALPDTLNKLAGFNERGISLLQSFQILGRATTGPLASELQAVDRDVTWNSSLGGALQRLRERVRTVRMAKLGILLERASAATGNLREVLDIAAEDATRTEHLKSTKRQSMMSYVVVVYLVFAVFLYVLYVVADLFYGPTGLGAAAAQGTTGSGVGIKAEAAKLLFAQAAVIQGVACGLVAGRLGEGHFLSGLKHSVILGIGAFFVFLFGVL